MQAIKQATIPARLPDHQTIPEYFLTLDVLRIKAELYVHRDRRNYQK